MQVLQVIAGIQQSKVVAGAAPTRQDHRAFIERMIESVSTHPLHQAGTPGSGSPVRVVQPALSVLIDLGALYGRQPHFRKPNVLLLADLTVVIAGELDAWVLAQTGWFGACRYRVKVGYGNYVEQSHLVPGWALKRASNRDLLQARMRGELRFGEGDVLRH